MDLRATAQAILIAMTENHMSNGRFLGDLHEIRLYIGGKCEERPRIDPQGVPHGEMMSSRSFLIILDFDQHWRRSITT